MKNVMYYYNSEFGEEVRDPHDAVRKLRIGDVIQRWSKRWSILDIRTSQRVHIAHDSDTVSVYLKGPF